MTTLYHSPGRPFNRFLPPKVPLTFFPLSGMMERRRERRQLTMETVTLYTRQNDKTLAQLDIRARFHLTIIAVRRG